MSRTWYHVHRHDTNQNADRKDERRHDLRAEDSIEAEDQLADMEDNTLHLWLVDHAAPVTPTRTKGEYFPLVQYL